MAEKNTDRDIQWKLSQSCQRNSENGAYWHFLHCSHLKESHSNFADGLCFNSGWEWILQKYCSSTSSTGNKVTVPNKSPNTQFSQSLWCTSQVRNSQNNKPPKHLVTCTSSNQFIFYFEQMLWYIHTTAFSQLAAVFIFATNNVMFCTFTWI